MLLASARTQVQLINGLLDITRIETGSMELDAAPFDPAAAVDEIVSLLAPEAQAKGLALSANVAPAAGAAFVGDALAVRQVLVNLIGNAIKFTDAGRVTVDLAASAGADGLALSVERHRTRRRARGPGPHLRPFRPGRRLAHPLRRAAPGSASRSPARSSR